MHFHAHAFLDWDDTLKVNHPLYVEASTKNGQLLFSLFSSYGETTAGIMKLAHDIDLAKVESKGLASDRFPEAWVDTYRLLCEKYSETVEERVIRRLWEEAASVLTKPQADVPGAPELLSWLKEHRYEVCIWTAGVDSAQRDKVRRSGFDRWIDNVYVVPLKTKEALSEAIGDRPKDRCFVVGNSPRSDIAPALEAGVCAFHVPIDTWAYDEAEVGLDHPLYTRVERLSLLPSLLRVTFGTSAYAQ